MEDVSLLWPEQAGATTRRVFPLSDAAVQDLRLASLAPAGDPDRARAFLAVLRAMPLDEETIRWRQEVVADLAEGPGIVDGFRALLPLFAHIATLVRERPDEELTLWRVLNRLRELDAYVNAVRQLDAVLEKGCPRSRALRQLAGEVRAIAESEGFRALAAELPDRQKELDQVRSVTLGINVNEWLEPTDVTLVSLNTERYVDVPAVSRVMDLFLPRGKGQDVDVARLGLGYSRVHQLSFASANPMFRLSRDITAMLGAVLRTIQRFLRRSIQVSTAFLLDREPELAFYLAALDGERDLEAAGNALCLPAILPVEAREARFEALYNPALARDLATGGASRSIVVNDLAFDDGARIYVLTGPNQGGKTTATQAAGQAQVLFQAGLRVPAARAAVSPVDGLFTHFAAAEEGVRDLGRLGEEAVRLRSILLALGDASLVLLNEPLTSTSHDEAVYIARDVLKVLRRSGCRAIVTTHLRDLALGVAEINAATDGSSVVASLVSGSEDALRSYVLHRAPPSVSSHARDVAVRHGLSFEQVSAERERRRGPGDSARGEP